jgi:hypothetical protein
MDLLGLLSALRRHRLSAAVAVGVALLAAAATAYHLPSLKPRSIAIGAATSQILVDSNPSTLVAGAGTDQIAALGSRAQVYAQYLSSRDAVAKLSRATGIPAIQITARGPFSQGTGIRNYEQQGAESRASDLTSENKQYRLVYEAQTDVPIITVYATGPSAETALKLANSSFSVLNGYVHQLEKAGALKTADQATEATLKAQAGTGTPPANADPNYSIVVRQLGAPEGGLVGGKASKVMMILAFIAVVGIQAFLLAAVFRLQEQRRALEAGVESPAGELAGAAAVRGDSAERADPDEPQRTRWQRAGSLRG